MMIPIPTRPRPSLSFRLLLALVCYAGTLVSPLSGQTGSAPAAPATNAASTNAPSTNAPATTQAIAPISLADVASQAQADTTQLKAAIADSSSDQIAQNVEQYLPGITHKIDEQVRADAKLLATSASLSKLQSSQLSWQALSNELASSNKDLSAQAQQLDALNTRLANLKSSWTATSQTIPNSTASAEIRQSINSVLTVIADATKATQSNQARIFSLQRSVAEQTDRIQDGLDKIARAIDSAAAQLFERDHPPLWNLHTVTAKGTGIVAQERLSLSEQISTLITYLQDKTGAVILHVLLFALLVMAFHWLRNTIRSYAKNVADLEQAAQVFDMPLATGLVLALLATGLFYPDKPPLLLALVGAVALIPAVIIVRRLIHSTSFSMLYATVVAYFIDQVREVAAASGLFLRFLFLAELTGACLFLLYVLRSPSLSAASPTPARFKFFSRLYFHFAFFVLIFAGFANVLGYVRLSLQVGDGMLGSSYLAIIFYAAVRIADALAICALNIRPFTGLGMVRRHRDMLYQNVAQAIRWIAFASWFLIALSLFALRGPLWDTTQNLLQTNLRWGSFSIQVGSILAFPITVWASFLLSRFIRFCLEEEVYPHMQLSRGIPYAASTLVHYSILVFGFFIAVKAGGGDLSQFSFLAGAFGVGLGFGLQNIFNNFVSGIILLFERPIKVGDTIQIDATSIGTVESIGIRASIIQLGNGAEMIIPNGNLISNPVTNWTLSNCERMIEIPVNVISTANPQRVLDILSNAARAHASVLKNPSPQAVLTAFAGNTLTFKLRCWIDAEDQWLKISSDISLAITAAFAEEKIITVPPPA